MKTSYYCAPIVVIAALLGSSRPVSGQSPTASRLFEKNCTTCHRDTLEQGAPTQAALRRGTPEATYAALAKAPHSQIQNLTDDEKRQIAGYLGDRKVGVAEIADAKAMPNHCSGNPPFNPLTGPSWNGWGVDSTNARFQPAKAAGLSAEQVPGLKLKWAFGFPGADAVYGQPSVAGGRVFIGVDTGTIYSLDAASGCVYWSFAADAGVRDAISFGPVKVPSGSPYAVYFGDFKANVYALDASSGKQLWKVKVEDHPLARITGAPTLFENRLYVPVSSREEPAGGMLSSYPCCTFRGSVVALDANTGKQFWKTYIISEPPKRRGKNSLGTQQWAPAGGAVWNSPTIDIKRHALYIGTGDGYTVPAPTSTDAIMALDLSSGKVLWAVQDTENDAWLAGCGPQTGSENCPKDLGPDYDFGASPILKTLPNGHRILVAGQKSGMVWAHDPDRNGVVVWKAQLVDKLALGMITFGGAADDQLAYFGLKSGGIAAVELYTGERKWFTPLEGAKMPGEIKGQTAALSGMPGAIFSGSWEGILRAFSTADGHLLWEYNTIQEFKTANHVPAKGGSMGAAGATIAGGMVFAGSGYLIGENGIPGNVLLAFAPE
jgi:polyvinyl alcohol dehydrogenase (cytochrome)